MSLLAKSAVTNSVDWHIQHQVYEGISLYDSLEDQSPITRSSSDSVRWVSAPQGLASHLDTHSTLWTRRTRPRAKAVPINLPPSTLPRASFPAVFCYPGIGVAFRERSRLPLRARGGRGQVTPNCSFLLVRISIQSHQPQNFTPSIGCPMRRPCTRVGILLT